MTNLVHKKPAPALQWLRKVSLVMGQIGGKSLDLSEFRFTFSVKRGDTQTPNTVRIRIYNLSDSTAHKLSGKEFSQVVLQAGYEGNFGIIFIGEVVQARRGRESAHRRLEVLGYRYYIGVWNTLTINKPLNDSGIGS